MTDFMPFPVPPLFEPTNPVGSWPPSNDDWIPLGSYENPYWLIRRWGLEALNNARSNQGVWDSQSPYSPGYCCFGDTYEEFVEKINDHFLADPRTRSERFNLAMRHFLYMRTVDWRSPDRLLPIPSEFRAPPDTEYNPNATSNQVTNNSTTPSGSLFGSALLPSRSQSVAMAASQTGSTGPVMTNYLKIISQALLHSATLPGLKPGDIKKPPPQYATTILPTAPEDRLLGMQFARVPYRVFLKDYWWRKFWGREQDEEYTESLNYGELYNPPEGLIPSRGLRLGERTYLRRFYEQPIFMDIVRNDWSDLSTIFGWEQSDFNSVEGVSSISNGEIKFALASKEAMMSSSMPSVPFGLQVIINPFVPYDFNPGVPLGPNQEWMPGVLRPLFPGPTGGPTGSIERSKWWPFPPPESPIGVTDPAGPFTDWPLTDPEIREIFKKFHRIAAEGERYMRKQWDELQRLYPYLGPMSLQEMIGKAFDRITPFGYPGYTSPNWRPPWTGIPAYSTDVNDTTGLPPPSYWENSIFNNDPNYTMGWFDWTTTESFNGPPVASESRNPFAEHSAKLWMWRFMTFHPSRIPPFGAVQNSSINPAAMDFGTVHETESVSGYMSRPLVQLTQQEILDYVGYGNMLRNGNISNTYRKYAFNNLLG